jgi:hypothetical protein
LTVLRFDDHAVKTRCESVLDAIAHWIDEHPLRNKSPLEKGDEGGCDCSGETTPVLRRAQNRPLC